MNISALLSRLGGRICHGRLDDVVWDALVRDQDSVRVAHGLGELRRPDVLEDEQPRGRVGLESLRRQGDVLFVQERRVDVCDVGHRGSLVVGIELAELSGRHIALLVLEDEDEVEDADGLVFDELGQRRDDLALELVTWERNDEVLDRTNAHWLASWKVVAAESATNP